MCSKILEKFENIGPDGVVNNITTSDLMPIYSNFWLFLAEYLCVGVCVRERERERGSERERGEEVY